MADPVSRSEIDEIIDPLSPKYNEKRAKMRAFMLECVGASIKGGADGFILYVSRAFDHHCQVHMGGLLSPEHEEIFNAIDERLHEVQEGEPVLGIPVFKAHR